MKLLIPFFFACFALTPTLTWGALVTQYGATANDASDDTAAFERALAANATVEVPGGTYFVNNLIIGSGKILSGIGPSAILKLPAGDTYMRSIVRVAESGANIKILNLTPDGNREAQRLTDANIRGAVAPGVVENGGMHGIWISAVKNLEIRNVITKNNWTDGICQCRAGPMEDSLISNVLSDNNRRQAISLRSMRNVIIEDATLSNTTGRYPGAGIDIESERTIENVYDLTIRRVTFSGNWGRGFVLDHKGGDVDGVVIEHSKFIGNGKESDSYDVVLYARGEGRDGVRNALFKNITLRNNDIARSIVMGPDQAGNARLVNIVLEGNKIGGAVIGSKTSSSDTIFVRNNCIEGNVGGPGVAASGNTSNCGDFSVSGGAGDGTTSGGTTGGGSTGSPVVGLCSLFGPGESPPQGYGAPWNPYNSSKSLLLTSQCNADLSTTLSVGVGNANHYIYKVGYFYTGAWQPFTMIGMFAQSSTEWLVGTGTYTRPPSSGEFFWVGYLCHWNASQTAWKCGCRDAACATGYWQLQGVKR